VTGTTTSPATNVTVNTSNAVLYADITFASTNQPWVNGNNTFTAIAKDVYGRINTNSVTVMQATNIFAYDYNGNLLSDGWRGFDYDDENQLIRVTVTNSWKSEFTYDGKLRRRVLKEFTWNGSSWTQTNEVHFIYDANVVVQERDANNLPKVTYTRGSDLSGTLQGAGGIGGLLARTDNTQLIIGSSSAHAYYHADGNGNVTMLINNLQLMVAKYLYDPFGNTLSLSGKLAGGNTYRFSSKEWNDNAGLYYYLYRFYDPNLQRWPNQDPLGEHGGLNLYRAMNNNPLSYIDPTGKAPQLISVSYNLNTGQSSVGYQDYYFGQGYGIPDNPGDPFAALDRQWNNLFDAITPPINPNTDPYAYAASQTAREMALAGIEGAAMGRVVKCPTMSKADRLNKIFGQVTSAPNSTTAQQAMQQMHTSLDAVEDAYSGVPKNPNPGLAPDGRMYPAQPDNIVVGDDGSITATSRGHITTYGSDGSITVTDRATGNVVYYKPGGG
jgi:RHS repeat-associated protein